jgi:hypothetical protein
MISHQPVSRDATHVSAPADGEAAQEVPALVGRMLDTSDDPMDRIMDANRRLLLLAAEKIPLTSIGELDVLAMRLAQAYEECGRSLHDCVRFTVVDKTSATSEAFHGIIPVYLDTPRTIPGSGFSLKWSTVFEPSVGMPDKSTFVSGDDVQVRNSLEVARIQWFNSLQEAYECHRAAVAAKRQKIEGKDGKKGEVDEKI